LGTTKPRSFTSEFHPSFNTIRYDRSQWASRAELTTAERFLGVLQTRNSGDSSVLLVVVCVGGVPLD
jgi:hypothetical protein